MIDNNPINVMAAFEILLEEIEAELDGVNRHGSDAFQTGDYAGAQEAIGTAKQITEFRQRLASLRREWISLTHGAPASVPLSPTPETEPKNPPRSTGSSKRRQQWKKLRPGLKTPEDEYRVPILRVLDEMGGSGRVSDVLDRVYTIMKARLNEYDHLPLPSNANTPRWNNTAQWCRNTMVGEGLLTSNSRVGVWEITKQGRKALQEADNP